METLTIVFPTISTLSEIPLMCVTFLLNLLLTKALAHLPHNSFIQQTKPT